MKKTALQMLMILTMIGFQNCANTHFGALAKSTESASEDSKPQGPVDEEIPVDINSVTEMPKITTMIPDCQPNTICRIQFTMQKALTLPVKFKWRTDDDPASPWKTENLPPNVIWGVAGTHYMAAHGEIEFKAGETVKNIDVQNINQSASGIRLKVLLNFCFVGEVSYACKMFF